nr:hypothetical protein [Opitutaceae bacterium]
MREEVIVLQVREAIERVALDPAIADAMIAGLEEDRANRFEPVTLFVSEAKYASELLAEGNPEKNRDFLKKIGSNLQMAEKSLAVEFNPLWKILPNRNPSHLVLKAPNHPNRKLAEREGFEPSVRI